MRLWCYSPRFIVMRTFTWPIALLLAGLLFQTVAFAVLNTVVPLWMEQSDAATWEAGLVGAFFFLGNLAGTLMAGGVIRKTGFKGSYQYACMLCAASTLLQLIPVSSRRPLQASAPGNTSSSSVDAAHNMHAYW